MRKITDIVRRDHARQGRDPRGSQGIAKTANVHLSETVLFKATILWIGDRMWREFNETETPFQWPWPIPNPDFKVTGCIHRQCLRNHAWQTHKLYIFWIGKLRRRSERVRFTVRGKWPARPSNIWETPFWKRLVSNWTRSQYFRHLLLLPVYMQNYMACWINSDTIVWSDPSSE